MSSRWIPAIGLIFVVGVSGCTIRTGEAADPHRHDNNNRRKSPPPPPPKKKAAEPKRSEPKQSEAPAPRPPAPAHSGYRDANEKWEKLGEGTANGKNDHDVIQVGRSEGKFRAIRFKVTNSDVKIQNVVIHFPDGTKFSPVTRLEFKEGQTSNTIDLPGERRVIKSVNFKYSDAKGTGNAQVEVWGI